MKGLYRGRHLDLVKIVGVIGIGIPGEMTIGISEVGVKVIDLHHVTSEPKEILVVAETGMMTATAVSVVVTTEMTVGQGLPQEISDGMI